MRLGILTAYKLMIPISVNKALWRTLIHYFIIQILTTHSKVNIDLMMHTIDWLIDWLTIANSLLTCNSEVPPALHSFCFAWDSKGALFTVAMCKRSQANHDNPVPERQETVVFHVIRCTFLHLITAALKLEAFLFPDIKNYTLHMSQRSLDWMSSSVNSFIVNPCMAAMLDQLLEAYQWTHICYGNLWITLFRHRKQLANRFFITFNQRTSTTRW